MAEAIGALLIEALFTSAATWGTVAVVSTTAATIVGTVVLAGASLAASYLLQSALTPSGTAFKVPTPSDGTQTLRQPISPRFMGYGRARIAGAYMLYEESGGSSYDVIALHEGRIGGFILYYLADDLVTIDGSGVVTAVTGGDDGRYTSFVTIKTRLGAATETAYSEIATPLSTIWTTNHRGDGVASAAMICAPISSQNYFSKYPRGLPKLSVVCDLAPLFDPRDGAQSRLDPSTWLVSRNPVLQIINYLTDVRGLGLAWDDIIQPVLDELMAEADLCDELVAKVGGTEERYQSSGWFYLTNDPVEILGSILAACDGWMAERGDGTLALTVGRYRAPSVIISDDHIIGFTIDHGVADEEIINEIKFSYNAPDNDYKEAPGAPWRDDASIAEVGRIRSHSMTLTWVQSHPQARRIAKRAMLRHQASLRGTLTVSLFGLMALGKRWVRVQSGLVSDLADAVIEIARARIDIANARVTFDWSLINPNEIDAWDPDTEEGTPPAFPGKLTLLPQLVPDNAHAVTSSDAKLQVVFTDPSRPDLGYAVEYRTPSGSGSYTRQEFDSSTLSGGLMSCTTDAKPAGTYDVRIASIASQGSVSEFADCTTSQIANGTAISGGGLASNPDNAFDGDQATYASGSNGTTGYVGRDWGAAVLKKVNRFVIKSPTGRSFSGAGAPPTITWFLEGSSDGSGWTTIDTGGDTDAAAGVQKTIDIRTTVIATAYRFHRVRLDFSASVAIRAAELDLRSDAII